MLIVSECRPPVGLPSNAWYGYSPLYSVVGAWPSGTFEMSQTENGQLGAPPRVTQVLPALPAKISARSEFFGSTQR